jgi:sec-independent protein translocase protein TatB
MQLFGIGPLEFILILVIAVIVLGPKGMVTGAREAGKLIRKVTHSPLWKEIVETSNEIRQMPGKIVREAGIEQELEDLRKSTSKTFGEIDRTHLPKITPAVQPSKLKNEVELSNQDEKINHG